MKITPFPNRLLVEDLERGMRTVGSIVLPDDNGKSSGIRARWARVYAVGSNITDITPGQWVLIENGRWTRSFNMGAGQDEKHELWGVDYPGGVLMVSDELPRTEIFSKWA